MKQTLNASVDFEVGTVSQRAGDARLGLWKGRKERHERCDSIRVAARGSIEHGHDSAGKVCGSSLQ